MGYTSETSVKRWVHLSTAALHPLTKVCSFVTLALNDEFLLLSFRSRVCAFPNRVYMIYVKLALVCVYAFGRSDLDDQAVMFWGIITFWSLWSCTHLPYRCRSSNR